MQQTLPNIFRWQGEAGHLKSLAQFYRSLLLLPLTAANTGLLVLAGNELSKDCSKNNSAPLFPFFSSFLSTKEE
jgi:hypothetical protein